MINDENILKRLELLEALSFSNGIKLAKLRADCELNGYVPYKKEINLLVEDTNILLNEIKMLRLWFYVKINEN